MAKSFEPLIVCIRMDIASTKRLTSWRSRYFPKDRNFLDAHITLYHKIPFAALALTRETLDETASATSAFSLPFTGLQQDGMFLSVATEAGSIQRIKAHVDARLSLWLAPQDRRKAQPHVTVMNKGSSADAILAWQELSREFSPWEGLAEGFQLFRYRGGPWEWLENFDFQG